MMEAGDTKFCTNCRREIAAANFIMHDLHCRRKIVLCDKCSEPVPRTQLAEHEASSHALVACRLCGGEVEASRLEAHESDSCPRRPVRCPVCEMEVGFDLFEEHVNYCESRTQRCDLCGHFVMMKDVDHHEASNCRFPERPPPAAQPASPPPGLLRESSFAARELQRMLDFPGGGAGFAAPELFSEATMLPCEFCGALFSADVILAHQSSCPRDADGDGLASLLTGLRMPPPMRLPLAAHSDDDDVDAIELPCEFCGEPFPADELPHHQAACPRDRLSSARRPPPVDDEFRRPPPVDDEFRRPPPAEEMLRPIGVRRRDEPDSTDAAPTVEDYLRPIAVHRRDGPDRTDAASTVEDYLRPIGVRRRDEAGRTAAGRTAAGRSQTGRAGAGQPGLRFGVGMWSSEARDDARRGRGRGRKAGNRRAE